MELAEGLVDVSSAQRGHESSESGSASSVALATAVTTSPGTLFSAALHLVQTFLSGEEWLDARPWRINRHWGQVVSTMPSLGFSFELTTSQLTSLIADSSTARHIRAIDADVFSSTFEVAQVVVQAIGRLIMLRGLRLDIGGHGAVNLKPLLALQQLRHFTLYTSKPWSSPGHFKVIRKLTSLESLTRLHGGADRPHPFSHDEVAVLCQQGHRLQRLKELSVVDSITSDMLEHLRTLPSLTRLEGVYDHALDLVTSASFRSLVSLRVRQLKRWSQLDRSILPQLKILNIRFSNSFQAEGEDGLGWSDVFDALHTLSVVCGCDNAGGTFLAHLYRAQALTSLTIDNLIIDRDTLVAALQPCTRLAHFIFVTHQWRSLNPVPRLKVQDEAALQPPSILLPQLKTCVFKDEFS